MNFALYKLKIALIDGKVTARGAWRGAVITHAPPHGAYLAKLHANTLPEFRPHWRYIEPPVNQKAEAQSIMVYTRYVGMYCGQ